MMSTGVTGMPVEESSAVTSLDRLVDQDASVDGLDALDDGVPLVHPEHGVGLFNGLIRIDSGALENEFVVLNYADDEKLYVPVSSLHLLSHYRYSAHGSVQPHRLGDASWQKERDRALNRAVKSAVKVHKRRTARLEREGTPCIIDEENYQYFCECMPFTLTPDQRSAIRDVMADLWKPYPMNRIVCGDVGFGKTEIAMHAAFTAVDAGLQVAILAPTILLASQHYQSFFGRFAPHSMHIELLTSAMGTAHCKHVLRGLSQGVVDIVIGTHQLLGKKVRFDQLGLLVVDEEHRFGVKHKRRLKKLRKRTSTLSLSATPIPRTLAQAVSGLRELSIINTPIPGRQTVSTRMAPWDDDTVRKACMEELARAGQVYVVHDRISTIKALKRRLQSLLPNAKIKHAHGRMNSHKLQSIVQQFEQGEADILVTTTIIETGIDNPNANTLIIDQAERFGLAQLHQLRGRVGRSSVSAVAWLMTSVDKQISEEAQQRLDAICQAQQLGAGALVAASDLEIRGAGELLGQEQSGRCEAVGFALYSEWLSRTMDLLRRGQSIDLALIAERQAEVDLGAPTLLPDSYICDTAVRLALYRQLSRVKSVKQLRTLQEGCETRYGELPKEARGLFDTTKCRLQCNLIGIDSLRVDDNEACIQVARAEGLTDFLVNRVTSLLGEQNCTILEEQITVSRSPSSGQALPGVMVEMMDTLAHEAV